MKYSDPLASSRSVITQTLQLGTLAHFLLTGAEGRPLDLSCMDEKWELFEGHGAGGCGIVQVLGANRGWGEPSLRATHLAPTLLPSFLL